MTELKDTTMFEFTVYTGRAGLDAIASEWSDLVQKSPSLRFIHHVEWIRSYLESFVEADDKVMFLVARRAGAMVAVFPVRHVIHRYSWMHVRALELLTHDHMILGDFLIPPSELEGRVFLALREWLALQGDIEWDVLMLDRIPESSLTAQTIAEAGVPLAVSSYLCSSSFIPYRATIDETLNEVSTSFKRNLRRLARRAEETAPLSFECVRDPELLPVALKRFLAVEASGWRGEHGTANAIKFDPSAVRFYECLVREFGAKGLCAITFLKHGDQDVATQFALLDDMSVNILVIGFSQEHSSFAPGNLLMERTINHFSFEGLAALSFVSSPTWGHLWKPSSERVLAIRVFRPSLRGLLLYGLLKVKHWRDARRRKRETPSNQAGPCLSS